MARRHPHLHVQTSYTDRHVDLITEGYDCAIRLGHLPDSNLIARRVGSISAKLVASPEYIEANGVPETPNEIPSHQSVTQGGESWQFLDGEEVVVIRPQGRFKADNGSALVAAALAGLGVAVLPEGLITEHLSSGALVPIMKAYPARTAGMFVVRPPSQRPDRKVRILTEMLIECFGQSPVVAARRSKAPATDSHTNGRNGP